MHVYFSVWLDNCPIISDTFIRSTNYSKAGLVESTRNDRFKIIGSITVGIYSVNCVSVSAQTANAVQVLHSVCYLTTFCNHL